MISTITIRVEVDTLQKATAWRNHFADELANADGITLVAANCRREQQTFTVIGVDTMTSEVFRDAVEADDEDSARDLAASEHRVVTFVSPAAHS